jgi:hypothetical protein
MLRAGARGRGWTRKGARWRGGRLEAEVVAVLRVSLLEHMSWPR